MPIPVKVVEQYKDLPEKKNIRWYGELVYELDKEKLLAMIAFMLDESGALSQNDSP